MILPLDTLLLTVDPFKYIMFLLTSLFPLSHSFHTFSAVGQFLMSIYVDLCLILYTPVLTKYLIYNYVIQMLMCTHFTSLLTAEPEPWPSEKDDFITSPEQVNGEASFVLFEHNTGRGCQAVHSPPPVGPQHQHYIDWFVTIPTQTVLGVAARRWRVW